MFYGEFTLLFLLISYRNHMYVHKPRICSIFLVVKLKICQAHPEDSEVKGKTESEHWRKGTIPWDLCKKERGGWWRKHRQREKERGREGGRERACLQPRHRGGSKVCALHLNGHPVTNTDEPGCVMLHSQGVYFMGKQVVIAWKSTDVFALCYSTAQLSAVMPFMEMKIQC